MFTGIITAIGHVESVEERGDLHIRIACPYAPESMAIGASIACSGVCLTVVERGGAKEDAWFAVDVSAETVSCTAKDQWTPGRKLNLEQALKMGDELGGHLVTGHVDAVGHVVRMEQEGGSWRPDIRAPADIAPFVAEKGSITVDGVSLTVNDVTDQPDASAHFTLNIIPHTQEMTTLDEAAAGRSVNLEIDILARYLARMQARG